MADTTTREHFKIAGQRFALLSRDIERALRRVDPEPISSHFVVVGGHRYPPKQVISEITGLDRADFTSHQARRILLRLGFAAGRRGGGAAHRGTRPAERLDLAEQLRPLAGQWVATKGDELLHSAGSPHELVRWLSQHGQQADSMFRVPADERAASGLAPL